MSDSTVVRFAHPVERELARVFDEHGVRWEYEPHTFVLERHADGSVHQAFTPASTCRISGSTWSAR